MERLSFIYLFKVRTLLTKVRTRLRKAEIFNKKLRHFFLSQQSNLIGVETLLCHFFKPCMNHWGWFKFAPSAEATLATGGFRSDLFYPAQTPLSSISFYLTGLYRWFQGSRKGNLNYIKHWVALWGRHFHFRCSNGLLVCNVAQCMENKQCICRSIREKASGRVLMTTCPVSQHRRGIIYVKCLLEWDMSCIWLHLSCCSSNSCKYSGCNFLFSFTLH